MTNIAIQIPDGVIECEKPTNKRFKDLTDQKHGQLTVVEYFGKKAYVVKSGKQAGRTQHDHYWLCQCECGEERVVYMGSLKSGKTTSCGCYSRAAASERRTTHGLTNHPSYGRYQLMVSRCTNPADKSYPNYGGRGLTIYPAWLIKKDDTGLKRYLGYLDSVLGPCPGPEYSIDRIDNDRGYYPGNLRWADRLIQTDNRRRCKTKKLTRDDALVIKFGNLPGTHKEIAEQFGVNPTTIERIRAGKRWAQLTQADYDALCS